MQSINIVNISGNDGWQLAAGKINENFRSLYIALQSNSDVSIHAISGDVAQSVKDAEARIDKKITESETKIATMIKEFEDRINDDIEDITPIPLGSISLYAGKRVPPLWMVCDGSEIYRSNYPDLFDTIGTSYGSASDETFALPDLRTTPPSPTVKYIIYVGKAS